MRIITSAYNSKIPAVWIVECSAPDGALKNAAHKRLAAAVRHERHALWIALDEPLQNGLAVVLFDRRPEHFTVQLAFVQLSGMRDQVIYVVH
jgi:hypothetical protein